MTTGTSTTVQPGMGVTSSVRTDIHGAATSQNLTVNSNPLPSRQTMLSLFNSTRETAC